MNILGEWLRRVWFLLNRTRIESDLRKEMEAHRAMMDIPGRFGNTLRLREEARDVWGWNRIDGIWQDFRFAWRALLQSPLFTLSIVLILGFGIGLNLMFFQIYNALYLKPLPVRDLNTLVRLQLMSPQSRPQSVPYTAAQFIRFNNKVLSAVLTEDRWEMAVWGNNASDRVHTSFVSANWFDELGYGAKEGRVFHENLDENPDSAPVIVIGSRFWEMRFNKDPNIIGREVRVNNRPAVVIGVAPPGFRGLGQSDRTEIWIPINQAAYFAPGREEDPEMYGRLLPGVSLNDVREQTRPLVDALALQLFQDSSKGGRLEPYPGRQPANQADSVQFMVVINGTLLVLIVVCANLSNLLMSRTIGRLRELSVRAALGASRWRVIRLLLIESAILAVIGATAAFAFSYWGLRLLITSTEFPLIDLSLDPRNLAAGLIAATVSAIAIGVIPAWEVSRKNLAATMNDGGQQMSLGLSSGRSRQTLIAAQVAGSCILLMISGQMLHTLQLKLGSAGYDMDKVAILDPHWTSLGIVGDEARSYWTTLRESIANHPDVEAVALVSPPLFNDTASVTNVADLSGRSVGIRNVSDDFFKVMKIPILRGRGFDANDDFRTTVILSETLVRDIYGSTDAIGQGFPKTKPERTIVGVVGDTQLLADIYRPLDPSDVSNLGLLARAKTDAEQIIEPMKAASQTATTKTNGVQADVRKLKSAYLERIQEQGDRFMLTLALGTATLTLALACIGILGLVAYGTNLRRKEIGIRMALGADRQSIVVLLMRQLIWPVAIGMIVGIAGSMAVAKAFVPGPGLDRAVPVVVALIVMTTTAIAAILPGYRAWCSSTLETLRSE